MKLNIGEQNTSVNQSQNSEVVTKRLRLGGNKIEQNSVDEDKKEEILNSEPDIYEEARRKLYNDFIQDFTDSALDNSTVSEEQRLAAEKRYKQIKLKRNILFGCICVAFLGITFFGVYNTFLKHELTYQEIAYIANTYNGKTNFPEDGVEGYLKTNMPNVISSNITALSKVQSIDVTDVTVSKIVLKNNTFANVYFYATLNTNIGDERIDCMVPLSWDGNAWAYNLAGDVVITPAETVDRTTDTVDNPYMSFEGINTASNDDTANAKSFIDNFFSMLYSGKDISSYYNGQNLTPGNIQYVRIEDFTLYTGENKNGFNAWAKIQVQTSNGLMYSTTKWIKMEKVQQANKMTWMVDNII